MSIVGEYQAIGPLYEPNGTRLIDPASGPELHAANRGWAGTPGILAQASLPTPKGRLISASLPQRDLKHAAYVLIPVIRRSSQQGAVGHRHAGRGHGVV